jgi:phosphate acyltransferase
LIKIALDAMGGDNAPHDVVHGGIEAARLAKGRFEVVLVGQEHVIRKELARHFRSNELQVSIVHAPEQIMMDESPSIAVKQKKDSSMAVAMRMHRKGEVAAVVSAGNTGALMATALFTLKRMECIRRPALGTIFPSETGRTLVLDVGANVDCRPDDLLKFGIMGSIFYSHLFNEPRPRVGLINIGHEDMKGNEVTQKAFALLSKSPINFIGNVEGGDVLHGVSDVVVCDGFVGNVVLKFGESLLNIFKTNMRKLVRKYIFSQIGAVLMKPTFDGIKKLFDYQEYGGAPFLGVQGTVIKAHGKSTPKAIKNAVLAAYKVASENVTQIIHDEIKRLACDEPSLGADSD